MRYIYCHPLFDERKCSHRFSFALERVFRENNLELERVDYRGTGESPGRFCDVTVESIRVDIDTVINGDGVCIIGTRFGATIAFDYYSRKGTAVRRIVLIEPIINGADYVKYLFRKQHLKDIMTGNNGDISCDKAFINLEGYKTNSILIEQIKQIRLTATENEKQADMNIHIVQISISSEINPEYQQLINSLKKNAVQTHIEVFNIPVFWERIPCADYTQLTEKIALWCKLNQ